VVPSGVQVGIGVRTAAVYRIAEQGNLVGTNNAYDLAIRGNGYFQVQLPSGEDAYTRAGSFQLSATGQLVTPDGYPVSPGITIPSDATDVTINDNGEVQVKLDGQVTPTIVGQIDLAIFFNDAGLEAIGDNLLQETPASGPATIGVAGSAGFGALIQGFLETSNVNPVQEITSLITAQRAYEMNSRVITTSDEMLQTTTTLR
jgi:flagellar basal-body rod protein FlgG